MRIYFEQNKNKTKHNRKKPQKNDLHSDVDTFSRNVRKKLRANQNSKREKRNKSVVGLCEQTYEINNKFT